MAGTSRLWEGAGVVRKIRAAGRPWTVGDIAVVADGQWGVGAQPAQRPDDEVERRVAEGWRVVLTIEELARVVAPESMTATATKISANRLTPGPRCGRWRPDGSRRSGRFRHAPRGVPRLPGAADSGLRPPPNRRPQHRVWRPHEPPLRA